MTSWINFDALWQIVALGLVCGAGLPALFAVGLRALNARGGSIEPVGGDQIVGGSRVGQGIAVVCFAVVLAAIAWGIYLIAAGA